MSKRTSMLGSVIREIIAPILRECPTQCGVVAITEIEVSSDFSYATIYVSALKEVDQAVEFLKKETPRLQRKMSALERNKIPMIRFRIDPRSERGSRIDVLLNG